MSRYLTVLRQPGALAPFVAAWVARLPIAMAPLGMILLVQADRGSYAIAGMVTAAFAVSTAITTPVWGSLVDRWGQPWVIGPLAVLSGVLLGGLSLAVVGGAVPVVLVGLAAGVGLAFPPVGPAMRGAWRVILDRDDDRRAAYALEAVTIETIFVTGPLLLSVLLVVTPAVVPLLMTAALLAVGGVLYSLTGAARGWRSEPHHHGAGHRSRSPLRIPGVLGAVMTAVVVAFGFGQLDVTIAATASVTLGDPSHLGLLFAALAGGSGVGGLVYGARRWSGPGRRRLPILLAVFAVGLGSLTTLLAMTVAPLWALLPLLFVTGLPIAPGIIVEADLVDQFAPRDRSSEAQAWLTTAFTSGGAAGNAVAGVLIDHGGPAWGFFGSEVALVAATVVAVACQRLWRTPVSARQLHAPHLPVPHLPAPHLSAPHLSASIPQPRPQADASMTSAVSDGL